MFPDPKKEHRYQLSGNKYDYEELDANKRPFNGRSHYGKLHNNKLPPVKQPTPQKRTNSNGWTNVSNLWEDDNLWARYPHASTTHASDGGRSGLRSSAGGGGIKPQVSQSAYFPSSTLYSKSMYAEKNQRKTSSEPSVSYYQRLGSPSQNGISRFSAGRTTQFQRRQNWTEPVVDSYPHNQATMHASELFDLHNNIQRSRFPH